MRTVQNDENNNRNKNIRYLIAYAVCFFALGLSMASSGVLLPYLAEKTGVSLAQISFLFTASSLGYMAGSAGGGRLYDRFKSHHLLLIAMIIMVLSSVIIPLISWFYFLLAMVLILGIGWGMVDIGGNLGVLCVFKAKAGPYMNALHFSFGAGAFISPIIISTIMKLTENSLSWPYWILSFIFLFSFIGLLALRSPENAERVDESEKKQAINVKLVAVMVILMFLYVSVETGFSGWIFTYATELQITTESTGSYLTSIFWGLLTLGRLLSITLAKKIPPSKLLTGNFILAIIFLGLIMIWPLNGAALWIGSAGLGLSLSSIFPTLMALGETRMKMTGKVTSFLFIGTSLGGTVVPTLLGQIFEYIGSYQMMVTLFCTISIGFIFLIIFINASNKAGERSREKA